MTLYVCHYVSYGKRYTHTYTHTALPEILVMGDALCHLYFIPFC